MSAATHGTGCGVVIGIVLVILFQQLGYVDLGDLVTSFEYLILGGVVGGVLGAVIGWALGRSYLARQRAATATSAK
jgi:hypothetical protein